MRQPVQLKVFFGSMLVTRKTYLLLSAGGFLLLGLVAVGYYTIYSPSSWLGQIIMREGPWFYDVLPWFLGGAAVLEIIEVTIVLRKFREREEFLKRERGLGSPDVNHE
jgi:hypothetical protein